ncbi:MAG: hypothetical protein LDL27_04750 [Desulfovibrio sp.]|nr:hypothetical protein [Desulfovibrio sp.]
MELGTRIRSAVSGGDVIATRTAVQPTATGDSRVIQLVDFASRQLPDWSRVLRSAVATPDPVALPASSVHAVNAWYGASLVAVGDCDRLVVAPRHTAPDGVAVITPVVLRQVNAVLYVAGMLEPRTSEASALRDSAGGGDYLAPVLAWDTCGAAILVLHVTSLGGAGNAVTLAGGALSETTLQVED